MTCSLVLVCALILKDRDSIFSPSTNNQRTKVRKEASPSTLVSCELRVVTANQKEGYNRGWEWFKPSYKTNMEGVSQKNKKNKKKERKKERKKECFWGLQWNNGTKQFLFCFVGYIACQLRRSDPYMSGCYIFFIYNIAFLGPFVVVFWLYNIL